MYPSLFRRVAATLIDLAVVFGIVAFIMQRRLIADSESADIWGAVAFVLLYEPVLTAYACTVGQAVMRTRVRDFESRERIALGKSFIRFFMKYVASVLGGASTRGAVKVFPHEDRRAIHDEAAGSVVLNVSEIEG